MTTFYVSGNSEVDEAETAVEEGTEPPFAAFGGLQQGERRANTFPSAHAVGAPADGGYVRGRRCDSILIVCDKLFLAECLKSVLQGALGAPVQICSSLDAFLCQETASQARLVLFLVDSLKAPDSFERLRRAAAVPKASVVVLSHSREPRTVRDVMQCGAKAYIPTMTGVSVAIEAVRFVLAGGTYVPPECLTEPDARAGDPDAPESANSVTVREVSIIQAIQQGKSNKVIAYELKLCESTVKVHIRNIMRKLNAKNRTEVAVRSAEFRGAPAMSKFA